MKTLKPNKILTLVVCAFGLALAAMAAPQTKIPFTQTEVTTWLNFGTVITDGHNLLILGATGTGVTTAGSDPRVLGESTTTVSAVWDIHQLGPMWGSYHKVGPDGTWDGYVQGTNSLENGHVVLTAVNVAVGGGGYQGLVLRKTGRSVDRGPVEWTGYIVAGGPGDLPMRVHGSRVDQLKLIPGMLLDPVTMQPTGQFGMLGVGSIVSCVGEATHWGRETETGVGLFDLTKSVSSSMGTVVTANGDLLHWVASSSDLPTGETSIDVHYVGGTGLLDDATGGFSSTIRETITPTADPMIYRGTFSFTARGTIRYSAPATIRK